ncbi:hypothetical protein EKO27_g11631, partial [Xylaria grammica]
PKASDNGGFDTPVIQLRDFAKSDTLAPGESATLQLQLTRKDISVWDTTAQNWIVPNPTGRYGVWIGQASDDLSVVCYTDSLDCEGGAQGPV